MSQEKQSNKKINRDILKLVIIGLVAFAVIVLIFGAGIVVGGMTAKFSYRWAESYHKNFAGPQGGFFGDWRKMPPMPGEFIEGHGAFGKIIEIEDSSFVVEGRDDVEKIIIMGEDTIIKREMETVEDGLKLDEYVVIIGSPNEQGQIEAKLIRIFDEEPNRLPMPYKDTRFQLL
jgi:hypothetical protein